jgi:hypothetical protein
MSEQQPTQKPKAHATGTRPTASANTLEFTPATLSSEAIQRALADPHSLNPALVQRLQGTIGNQAVQRLLQNGSPTSESALEAVAPAARTTPIIQPSLRVGPVRDRFEEEADQIAQQIVQRTERIQRASKNGATDGLETSPSFKQQLSRTAGQGKALPPKTREEFEPLFGASFDSVRIHTGAESKQLAQSIQAKAFTHGNHIHFGTGEFNPTSRTGKQLLAHELTHTVQQGAAPIMRQVAPMPSAVASTPALSETIQRDGNILSPPNPGQAPLDLETNLVHDYVYSALEPDEIKTLTKDVLTQELANAVTLTQNDPNWPFNPPQNEANQVLDAYKANVDNSDIYSAFDAYNTTWNDGTISTIVSRFTLIGHLYNQLKAQLLPVAKSRYPRIKNEIDMRQQKLTDARVGTIPDPTTRAKFATALKSLPGLRELIAQIKAQGSASQVSAVKFKTTATTEMGQGIFVVGNTPELGNWDPAKAAPLAASAYPTWSAEINLPANTAVEYKYIKKQGATVIAWEENKDFANRSFTTPAEGGSVARTDTWGTRDTQEEKLSTVTFKANASTAWGQNLFVVGNTPELGNWDTGKAVALSPASYPIWSTMVKLPVNKQVEYKYFQKDGSQIVWEENSDHDNRRFTATDGALVRSDQWGTRVTQESQSAWKDNGRLVDNLTQQVAQGTEIPSPTAVANLPAIQDKIEKADRFYRGLMEPDVLNKIKRPRFVYHHVQAIDTGGTYGAFQNGGVVHFGDGVFPEIMIHEVGHYVENNLPVGRKLDIQTLLRARHHVQGGGNVLPNNGQGSRFGGDYPASGPYTSRAYSDGSEVTSMTLERVAQAGQVDNLIDQDPQLVAVVVRNLRPTAYATHAPLREFDEYLP